MPSRSGGGTKPSAVLLTSASSGPAVLAREIGALAPALGFREMLSRGGWYRLGGVVDANGTRVAEDVEQWVAGELAAHDDDLGRLWDDYADSGLCVRKVASVDVSNA